jgi:hypothetical protein
VNFEGGVNNLFGDLVLGHGMHCLAKTEEPQTEVSRKDAKVAKDAKKAAGQQVASIWAAKVQVKSSFSRRNSRTSHRGFTQRRKGRKGRKEC